MTERNPRLAALADAGVSIWLDDLSRARIRGGGLADIIKNSSVTGVTTNPTIFAKALSAGDAYNDQVSDLAVRGDDLESAVFAITTTDVRDACDLFKPVFDATDGVDGRVSIEVDPRLARDTVKTVAEAKKLWAEVDRENLFIKIPATAEGLPAIAEVLGEGISVNVTLIFSLGRYRDVMDAFMAGVERAGAAGHDLTKLGSVASFFVSRVDSEVDKRLDEAGSDEAKAVRGKAAIANARLAFQAYEEAFGTARWKQLAAAGAKPQRPLWASTGTKDKAYPDTVYVTELVTDGVVNTMPEATIEAYADHGEAPQDTVRGTYTEAQQVIDTLAELGISYDDVVSVLEDEGVRKFEDSWKELLQTVAGELDKVKKEAQ